MVGVVKSIINLLVRMPIIIDSAVRGLNHQAFNFFEFIKDVLISDRELEALKRENREAGRASPGDLSSTSGGNNEAKMAFKPFIYGGDLDD